MTAIRAHGGSWWLVVTATAAGGQYLTIEIWTLSGWTMAPYFDGKNAVPMGGH